VVLINKIFIFSCSLECYKKHLKDCSTVIKNEDKLEKNNENKLNISAEVDYLCRPPVLGGGYVKVKDNEFYYVDEGKLLKLENCDNIKSHLKEPGIRNLIIDICNSHEPIEQLEKTVRLYPTFQEFLDEILRTIEFLPQNETRTNNPHIFEQLFASLGLLEFLKK
jgi:hypothetical protein